MSVENKFPAFLSNDEVFSLYHFYRSEHVSFLFLLLVFLGREIRVYLVGKDTLVSKRVNLCLFMRTDKAFS